MLSRALVFLLVFLSSLEAEEDNSGFEIGYRAGLSYKTEDRLDRSLRNFSTSINPFVLSTTNLGVGRTGNYGEVFFKSKIDTYEWLGFVFGNSNPVAYSIANITTEPFYMNLNSNISFLYALFVYTHDFPIFRKHFASAAVGGGFTQGSWFIEGFGFDPRQGYIEQKGNLIGNGMTGRVDLSYKYRPEPLWFFEIGTSYQHYFIPDFTGAFNDSATSSFYVDGNGRVAPLNAASSLQAVAVTNDFSRKLDMSSGAFSLYFSGGISFSN